MCLVCFCLDAALFTIVFKRALHLKIRICLYQMGQTVKQSTVRIRGLRGIVEGKVPIHGLGLPGLRGSGAPGHWGSHDPLKIITGGKSKVKFIFQSSASLDPRTGLSPSTSPSSPPTPPPRRRYRPTKSLQFACHVLLSIPHRLLHALLLILFLTLLQTFFLKRGYGLGTKKKVGHQCRNKRC